MATEAPSAPVSPSRFPQEPAARVVFFGSLAVGLLLRAHIVFTDDGINWPDEIYQSFEPAHRLVFGHGLVAWEFLEGARTWAVPGFVAVWLSLCKLVGADSPATYIAVVKLVFSGLSVLAAVGVYRLARGLGARELESAVASATWSLCAFALYFSARAMSENLAAVLLVWGLAMVLDEGATREGRITSTTTHTTPDCRRASVARPRRLAPVIRPSRVAPSSSTSARPQTSSTAARFSLIARAEK